MARQKQMNSNKLAPEEKAQSCWALANSYSTSSRHLQAAENSTQTFMPSMFLLLHALELHLKAYLIARGHTDKQLRAIGHDLTKGLRACFQNDLASHVQFSWRELIKIARVNHYYKGKELEYFVPKAKNFGNVERLAEIVDRVSRGIFNPITDGSFRALRGP